MFRLLRRLRARFRHRHFEADLREELDAHRAMAAEELRANGIQDEDDARRQATRALGNVTLARESARAVWIAPWLESVWQDVRYGVRGLRASPSFTIPAFAVLVITMGLTTSLYVTAESILFRPWPVPEPDRMVSVITTTRVGEAIFYRTGVRQYSYLREHARTIDPIAMTSMSLRLGSAPPGADSEIRLVSGNYFQVLRTPLVAGRGLISADDAPGHAAVTVVSESLAEREFSDATDAIGATLHIDGVPFTIVGVTDHGATDDPSLRPDVWVPLQARRLWPPQEEPSTRALFDDTLGCCLTLAGRLADGADPQSADAELRLLAGQFAAGHGVRPLEISATGTEFANQPMSDRALRLFGLLSLGTILILVLGCANVGNLQLARGLSRQGEVAVRLALGASRPRVVRQWLVESLVLAGAAAAVSVLIAPRLPRLILPEEGRASASLVSLDSSIWLFASGLVLAVSCASGLLPALRTTRINLRVRTVGIDRGRARSVLLGLQVAISAVLLIGTALLVRGVQHAGSAGLGFDPYGVAAVSIGLPREGYDPAARELFSRRLDEALRQELGAPFAVTAHVPFRTHRASYDVHLPGEDDGRLHRAVTHQVTPRYFDLLGIPLVAGRVFGADAQDEAVVINESLARLLWADGSVVGRVFLDGDVERRVTGVVADARTENFDLAMPAYYQGAGAFSAVLVPHDPATVARVEDIIRRLDPQASPGRVDFVSDLERQLRPSITGAAIAAALGSLALLLAAIGTLGVFAYVVNERMGEIGLRLALGARASHIVGLLVARMSWALTGGLVVGFAAALIMVRLIAGALHGLSPYDPVAYVAVLVVLITAAVLAALGPVRRALGADPAVTLRHE